MVELYYIAIPTKHIKLHLHLRGQQRQQVVEMIHVTATEDKFMEFEKVIPVFIYIDLQSTVERMRCKFVVVGKGHDVITQPFVDLVHIARPIFALVQNAVDTCMGVEITLFPAMRGVDIMVWVVNIGPGKWLRLRKVVDEAATCGHKNHQHDEEQRVQ